MYNVHCTYICSWFGNNKWSMRQTHIINKLGGPFFNLMSYVPYSMYIYYIYNIRVYAHTRAHTYIDLRTRE